MFTGLPPEIVSLKYTNTTFRFQPKKSSILSSGYCLREVTHVLPVTLVNSSVTLSRMKEQRSILFYKGIFLTTFPQQAHLTSQKLLFYFLFYLLFYLFF